MEEILYIARMLNGTTTEAVALIGKDKFDIEKDMILTDSLVEYKKWYEKYESKYNIEFITLGVLQILSDKYKLDLDIDIEQIKEIPDLVTKYFEIINKLNEERVEYEPSMQSPLNWFGGKSKMVKDLIKYLPPKIAYTTYIELFGGASHFLFKQSLNEIEIYNDIHIGLVNFFKVLQDEKLSEQLYDLLTLTLYAREEFKESKLVPLVINGLPTVYTYEEYMELIRYMNDDKYKEKFEHIEIIYLEDEVERARKFFIMVLQSFGSLCKNWSYSTTVSRGGCAQCVNAWLNHVNSIIEGHKRFKYVIVENESYEVIVKKHSNPNVFIYADCPYVHSTRVSKDAYEYELSDKMQIEMCNVLSNTSAYVMISGYDNDIYDKHLKGFRKIKLGTYTARSSSKKEKGNRVEILWMNYDELTGVKFNNKFSKGYIESQQISQ